MKNTTRWVALAAAGAIAVGMLAGCSSGSPSGGNSTDAPTDTATGALTGAGTDTATTAATDDASAAGGAASGQGATGELAACDLVMGDDSELMDKPLGQVQMFVIGDPTTFGADELAKVESIRQAFQDASQQASGSDLAQPLSVLAASFQKMKDAAAGSATWDSDADGVPAMSAVTDVIVECTRVRG